MFAFNQDSGYLVDNYLGEGTEKNLLTLIE